MSKLIFVDTFKFTPSERMYTEEGYLVAPARFARPGIQLYRGSDLMAHPSFPADKFDEKSIVRMYRPPTEVFDKDSMNSFKNVPVTDNHPPQLLSARTYRKHTVGNLLSDVGVDVENGCLIATIKVMDEKAVKNIASGKVQMSAGYKSEIVFEDGVSPDGEPYDAIQKGIEGNHVAIVDKGRAGESIKIADACAMCGAETPKMPNMKIVVDGESYTIQGESKSYFLIGQMMKDSAAEFLREQKEMSSENEAENTDEDYNEVNAGKKTKSEPEDKKSLVNDAPNTEGNPLQDEDIKIKQEILMDLKEQVEKLEAENAELIVAKESAEAAADVAKTALSDAEAKVPTVDQIDALVAERSEVVAKCSAIVDGIETEGKSNLELKTEAVKVKLGDSAVEGKSETYIEAAFDIIDITEVKVTVADSDTTLNDAFVKEAGSEGKPKELSSRDKFMQASRDAWKK